MISIVIPVFRDAEAALALTQSLQLQELPDGEAMEIIVVDDGSGDETAAALQARLGEEIILLSLPHNMGRSTARNRGAEQARGEFLVFIDCDCRPTSADFLASHLMLLHNGCIATCGPITSDGGGFWSRYQRDASMRRTLRHAKGDTTAGTTANFAVGSAAFRQAGGFDTRYTKYGFEDRDLLIRLARQGTVGWCAEAVVRHLDPLTLAGVLQKMQIAATASAQLFMQDHPEEYKLLGYAAIDARLRPWLRPVAALCGPLYRVTPAMEALLGRGWLPYRIARVAVKLLVAAAYLRGSAEREVP